MQPGSASQRLLQSRLPLLLLLTISFALVAFSHVLDQTVRWSDHAQGFIAGTTAHLPLIGIFWCAFLLPWALGVYWIFRWRNANFLRDATILMPAVAVLFAVLYDLVAHPPTVANRFRDFTGTPLPDSANVRYSHFSGGFVSDYEDTYYFTCSPAEVDQLIHDLHLTQERRYPEGNALLSGSMGEDSRLPDLGFWRHALHYHSHTSDGWDFDFLIHPGREHVYVRLTSI